MMQREARTLSKSSRRLEMRNKMSTCTQTHIMYKRLEVLGIHVYALMAVKNYLLESYYVFSEAAFCHSSRYGLQKSISPIACHVIDVRSDAESWPNNTPSLINTMITDRKGVG